MAKKKTPKGAHSTEDIFQIMLDEFGLQETYTSLDGCGGMQEKFREKVITAIRRYFKNNDTPYTQGEKRTKLYDSIAVNELRNDKKIAIYFRKLGEQRERGDYQTNSDIWKEQLEANSERSDDYYESLDAVGIQYIRLPDIKPNSRLTSEMVEALRDSKGNPLKYERFERGAFLDADELEALQKETLTLRADLSESEKIELDKYEVSRRLECLMYTEENILNVDSVTERNYLRVDELEWLDKKGICKRAELSSEDKRLLYRYEQHLKASPIQEKEVEDRYRQKKLEIMISALFSAAGVFVK